MRVFLLTFTLSLAVVGGCPDADMLVRLECSPGDVRDCDENGEIVLSLIHI